MKPHWEHFEHQADMGVRGYGPIKAQAFEQAAKDVTQVIEVTHAAGLARKFGRLRPIACVKG